MLALLMRPLRAAALLILVGATIGCSTKPVRETETYEPTVGVEGDRDARDRWYWEQRTYPAGTIPIDVHRRALQRELATHRILADADEAWTNLGPAPLLDITYGLASTQNTSGRALSLAIHPSDPNVLLLGTAQGGIWKSTDRGATWRSIGESTLPTLAINVIKYSPADASVVYAGTGEPNASTSVYGAGLLKSTDGGETWSVLSSRGEGWNFEYASITGLHFDARSAQTMFITTAAINSVFQSPPNAPQTGIFKSTDGGETWTLLRAATRYATISLNSGFVDLEYGGTLAPDLIFVSEYLGGILRSTDGGATWSQVTPRKANGLGTFPAEVAQISYPNVEQMRFQLLRRIPNGANDPDFRRPEIALAASNPQIVFAGFDAHLARLDYDGNGVFEAANDRVYPSSLLFKSVDGGETWSWLGTVHDGIPDYCSAQCTYDNVITVNPLDADDLWLGGMAYYVGFLPVPMDSPRQIYEMPWRGMIYRSRDGGRTWLDATPHCTRFQSTPSRFRNGVPVYPCAQTDATHVIHPDTHAIVLGSDGAVYVANDGGLYRTMTEVASAAPSKRRAVGTPTLPALAGLKYRWENLNNDLSTLQFYRVGSHPTNPNIILGGMQDNSAGYWDGSAWHGWGAGDGTIAIFDPRDPQHVYVGTQFAVHRHDSGGTKHFSREAGWVRNVFGFFEKETERASFVPVFVLDPVDPAITYGASNEGLYRSVSRGENSKRLVPQAVTEGTTTSISVSPVDHNVVWVGTSQGVIYRYDITPATQTAIRSRVGVGLPTRSISRVVASHESADTVYAVFNGYDANTPNTPGKVFISTDRGATWRNISSGLPDVPATALALDPLDPNRMWLASDAAVYSTANRGETWQSERRNMPVVAVQDLEYNSRTGYLIAATHGRGVWRMTVGSQTP